VSKRSTILFDLITGAIYAPPEKFIDKQAKSIQERVTYLEKVVGRSIDLQEIKKIYRDQIEKVFEVELYSGELTEKERTCYSEMEREYTSDEFFMERSETQVKCLKFKVPKVKGTKMTITCFRPVFIGLKMGFPIL